MTTLPTSAPREVAVDAMLLRRLTDELLSGRDLSQDDARGLLLALADGEVADAIKGALLGALRVKGETADEVRGLALAMRDLATPLPGGPIEGLVDTCGTGGDGSGSLNISTAAALLAARCGLKVAKHGNRSVSSRSGSADVLEALGMPLPDSPAAARRQLDATGFTFLFAPLFHPAMKGVAAVRRAIGARTVFNLLGPLTNPARPRHQLIGAYSQAAARRIAQALAGMGVARAFVVHGEPGWDEATPCGRFVRFEVRPDLVREQIVDPAAVGIPRCAPEDLEGGDPATNAARLRAVLAGRDPGPHEDAVVLNTALVLEVAGLVPDLRSGVTLSRSLLR
jgi:anthranilate phosphoribosyltransferase